MSMITECSPTLSKEFNTLVSEMDPSARTDFIFMVIISAICFYDPNQSGLQNTGIVFGEQSLFYGILKKLIVSQSSCFSAKSYEIRANPLHSSLIGPPTGGSIMGTTMVTGSVEKELEEKIFGRLRVISKCFEDSVLIMEPEETIRIISRELKLKNAQTIYNVLT